MPFDEKGSFHMSGLRPGKDGKLPKTAPKARPAMEDKPTENVGGEDKPDSVTIHKNPDGGFISEHHDTGDVHDHANLEELKAHLDKFLGEEGHEGDEDGMEEETPHHSFGFGG